MFDGVSRPFVQQCLPPSKKDPPSIARVLATFKSVEMATEVGKRLTARQNIQYVAFGRSASRNMHDMVLWGEITVISALAQMNKVDALGKVLQGLSVDAVNYRDYGGYTALHKASAAGCTEAVRALVEAGALVNSKSMLQETALDLAQFYGQKDVICLLDPDGIPTTSAGSPHFLTLQAQRRVRIQLSMVFLE
eukprot:TRINITY_DN7933_c0_g1_i1.p1 TRINITY_DN7933_c0_g1~~TRINITY_DN7933_c0_g1_i1.p1  ORF type:complete len:193 (+),score=28.15 TRINITY_DN7933_c0_g1_i1:615-1193(+)